MTEEFVVDHKPQEAIEVKEIKEITKHLQSGKIQTKQRGQQTQELIQQEINQRFVRQQQEADKLQQLLVQNLHSQVNQITDKVYGKLEKRLQNERRRRGW